METVLYGALIGLIFSFCALIGVVIGVLANDNFGRKKTKKEEKAKEKEFATFVQAGSDLRVLLDVSKIKRIHELKDGGTVIYYGHDVKTGGALEALHTKEDFNEVIRRLKMFLNIDCSIAFLYKDLPPIPKVTLEELKELQK